MTVAILIFSAGPRSGGPAKKIIGRCQIRWPRQPAQRFRLSEAVVSETHASGGTGTKHRTKCRPDQGAKRRRSGNHTTTPPFVVPPLESVQPSRGAAAAICRGAGPTVTDDCRNPDLLGRAALRRPGQENHWSMANPVAEATGTTLSPLRGCRQRNALFRRNRHQAPFAVPPSESVQPSRGAAAAICRGAGPTVTDDCRNPDLLGRAALRRPGQENHWSMSNPVAEATGTTLSPLRGCRQRNALFRRNRHQAPQQK
ncbi:hypothetical protein K227x_26530 [Rubripirellula lacrimiformis]|uniref:Uncharacterized protein n=1 Tax=Rubripirellula lacrimiformis TaxID=1930273 RepID=A0A517NAV2_9BACT|nr:hypothetical protein K227x_26530 [Rubripirellula lacrimiformis]